MKKLLIYLLTGASLNGFISATPCYCLKKGTKCTITATTIKTEKSVTQNEIQEPEFHPLSIIGLRFQ